MDNMLNTTDTMLILSNRSNITAHSSIEPTHIATAIGAAIMSFFLALGLLGNLWIIIALSTRKRLASIINVFIISLVINDLLTYAMVVVFIIDSFVAHEWNAGVTMCRLNPELTVLFTGCSLWHTALIAIHRYIVVCHNHLYKRMSKTAYVAFVLIATRAIPASGVFPKFDLSKNMYYPKMLRCLLGPAHKTRMILNTLAQIIVPCIIVVVCYALVFGFVHRISRHIYRTNRILKREIQITKMFGVVFITILLGFIPYAILRNADKGNSISADVYVVATVVYAIASCSNPIVYGAMSTDIRSNCISCFKDLVRCLNICHCMICVKFDTVQDSNTRDFTNACDYNTTDYCCSRSIKMQVVPSTEKMLSKNDTERNGVNMNTRTSLASAMDRNNCTQEELVVIVNHKENGSLEIVNENNDDE